AGTSPEKIVEIHGNVHEVKCLRCDWRGPMEETLDRVRNGEEDPCCFECGGMLKSATISFGENLVPADLERAQRAAAGADVFLAVGPSLGVYPAAALPELALRAGASLAVLHGEETPFHPLADVVIRVRPGAVFIPRGHLESQAETKLVNRDQPVVVYCAGGNRSAFAAETLQQLGFTDVVSMAGGFGRWKNEGRPWITPQTLTPEQRDRYG